MHDLVRPKKKQMCSKENGAMLSPKIVFTDGLMRDDNVYSTRQVHMRWSDQKTQQTCSNENGALLSPKNILKTLMSLSDGLMRDNIDM